MYSLIQTAKLNSVDSRASLTDVLAPIADMSQQRLHELLPWNWKQQQNIEHSTARRSENRGTRRMVT
ncbi:MAG: transposase domain-containing protein [Cutibacterium sp.]|nr:transposase domain-containing protein [Cutibacterium sp.]